MRQRSLCPCRAPLGTPRELGVGKRKEGTCWCIRIELSPSPSTRDPLTTTVHLVSAGLESKAMPSALRLLPFHRPLSSGSAGDGETLQQRPMASEALGIPPGRCGAFTLPRHTVTDIAEGVLFL